MIVQNNSEKTHSEQDEISLKELILKIQEWWRFLLSKWAMILIAGIVGGLIGLTYAWLKKPVYEAELSFALENERSSSGGFSSALGLASQFGIDLGGGGAAGDEFSGDNLLELIKSRSIVEKALLTTVSYNNKNITLAEFYINFNEYRKGWENKPEKNIQFLPNADRSKFTLKQDSLLGVFYSELVQNSLSVNKVDKKLSIILLKVTSKSELFAKYFAEVLTKVVSDFYIQTKTGKSVKNVNLLQRKTDSVRHALNDAISDVATSTDANPNANPLLLKLRVPSQRRQVDIQFNTAILNELVKNLEVAKMSLLQSTPLIQIIDKPILPLNKEKLSKAKGLIIGVLLGGIFTVIILLANRALKKMMA